MRHRWMCLPMIGLLCLLGGAAAEESPAPMSWPFRFGGEYLSMEGFTARVELEADYGERVYAYAMDTSYAGRRGSPLPSPRRRRWRASPPTSRRGRRFWSTTGCGWRPDR